MADDKSNLGLFGWLGIETKLNYSEHRTLGGLMGAILLVVIILVLMAVLIRFIQSLMVAPNSTDARNFALILAALLGVPFVIWRAFVAQKQVDIAEQGHMTDRISKAVEQLGAEKTIQKTYDKDRRGAPEHRQDAGAHNVNKERYYSTSKSVPNLEVRLGAIYALERIAQDSMRDHISVMEILCAYVRSNAPVEKARKIEVDTEAKNWTVKLKKDVDNIDIPPIDIQAVLRVIGRRKSSHIEFEMDAENNQHGHSYKLDLSNTNLQKLDLSMLNFDNAVFSGAMAQGADFHKSTLKEAKLGQTGLQLSNFGGASMQAAYLREAELLMAKMGGARLQEAYLRKAKMQNASLRRTQLQGANLRESKLSGVALSETNFDFADLRDAVFEGSSKLKETTFYMAAVRGTDFATLNDLSSETISLMVGDSTTKLPEEIEAPHWSNWECSYSDFVRKWKTTKDAEAVE